MHSRRSMLKAGLLSGLGLGSAFSKAATTLHAQGPAEPGHGMPPPSKWGRGFEGQRKADLGDGRYLNPIFAGDHPDPTILKDGADYYMTFSTFEAHPGLLLWHSRDLVNWEPIANALSEPLGSVLAVDLCKHQGRYYIYIPGGLAGTPTPRGNYVIHADNIRGPWSKPINLNVGGIDPGHVVGEDGKRYLFLSGGNRIQLTDDGLAAAGPVTKVYEGWKIPEDWIVEAFSLESPKLFRRGDYFYLVCAEGGTYGPPTGHMAIVARSRSINGPWENSPHNPLVRAATHDEPWWSRGHATLVEGPAGDWWTVYHAYENGYQTLGRQTLLEPIAWTADGWPKAVARDLSQPLTKPRRGQAVPHGIALSDDFTENRIGRQWTFYAPGPDGDPTRVRYTDHALVMAAKGTSPADCSPLTCHAGDHAYEVSVEVELAPQAAAGLLLFYSRTSYLGLGHDGARLTVYRNGQGLGAAPGPGPQGGSPSVRRIFLKIQNDRHIITFFYGQDGVNWTRQDPRLEAAGYHNNAVGGSLSLRPGLFAAGAGDVTFRQFRYRAL